MLNSWQTEILDVESSEDKQTGKAVRFAIGHRIFARWEFHYLKQEEYDDVPNNVSIPSFPEDEQWMRRIEVPRLHLILDSYSKIVSKTGWWGRLGGPLQIKLHKTILAQQIRRFSLAGNKTNPFNTLERLNKIAHSFTNVLPYSVHLSILKILFSFHKWLQFQHFKSFLRPQPDPPIHFL